MMRCLIYIAILFASKNLSAQSIKYEENALDFFMLNIFKTEYPRIKSIEFSGYTANRITILEIGNNCFDEKDVLLQKALANNAVNKTPLKREIIFLPSYNIKVKRINMNSSRHIKLRITEENYIGKKDT